MGASTYSSGIAIGGEVQITAISESETTGIVTVGAGGLILKEGINTASSLTWQAKKIEATDTTLTVQQTLLFQQLMEKHILWL